MKALQNDPLGIIGKYMIYPGIEGLCKITDYQPDKGGYRIDYFRIYFSRSPFGRDESHLTPCNLIVDEITINTNGCIYIGTLSELTTIVRVNDENISTE